MGERIRAPRRRGRIALAIAVPGGAALIGVLAGFFGLVARRVVTPPRVKGDTDRILAVDHGTNTIDFAASDATELPGRYGLWFDSLRGYARVGDILSSTAGRVRRRVIDVDFGELDHARRGRLTAWFYRLPQELGHPVREVEVPTELGAAPAWLVSAESGSGRWAVHVHGHGVTRAETLRGFAVFRRRGFTNLAVSYRNDGEAPPSADGRVTLGDTEWRDVEAAIEFAAESGAREVVLVGWSMGGGVVLQTVTRAAAASVALVRGVVLDSPALDWRVVLDFQLTRLRRMPPFVAPVARAVLSSRWTRWMTGLREPLDFGRLSFVERAGELRHPILLLHSDDDAYVPATASHALAAVRPELVTFERFDIAGHVRMWNLDPERWEAAIERWLDGIGFDDPAGTQTTG